jgi:hypothetical protein
MKLAAPIVKPLVWLTAIPPDVCAEYMLFALLSGEKGYIRRNDKGDDVGMKYYCGSEEGRRALWTHTVKEVDTSKL